MCGDAIAVWRTSEYGAVSPPLTQRSADGGLDPGPRGHNNVGLLLSGHVAMAPCVDGCLVRREEECAEHHVEERLERLDDVDEGERARACGRNDGSVPQSVGSAAGRTGGAPMDATVTAWPAAWMSETGTIPFTSAMLRFGGVRRPVSQSGTMYIRPRPSCSAETVHGNARCISRTCGGDGVGSGVRAARSRGVGPPCWSRCRPH